MNASTPQSEPVQVGKQDLLWHRWRPPTPSLRGAFFFLHGQGDYGLRYQEVAEVFLEAGIAFTICDLPGHGLSPGKRGHIPSLDLVQEVARLGLAEARALVPDQPVGFGGHSAGGLLALYLLGELEEQPDFSWVSSPLLQPQANQAGWKYQVLRAFSYLLPQLTLPTGVSGDDCRIDSPEGRPAHYEQFHTRISLQWAQQLITIAGMVRDHPERLPTELPLFLTQGGIDPVCPPSFCQDLASKLTQIKLKTKFYPEGRHEPFSDVCREEVFADLRAWLDETLDS